MLSPLLHSPSAQDRARVRAACLALAGLTMVAVAACSPEASRTRGDGPGADVGNRGVNIELHPSGSEAYYGTPNLNPSVAPAKK
ncbi:MAG TPA: hypothetical protein VKU60_08095 [Chloroflexota bacterium]|nr:hypothetical protein [Chloroflexota bacterium]